MFFRSKTPRTPKAAPLLLQSAPARGFYAGTTLACNGAWVDVADLKADDIILTAEHGPQVITDVRHVTVDMSGVKPAADAWPIHVPEGVLGNATPMVLAPDMHIVFEGRLAREEYGVDCVSVPAASLIGFNGIARARMSRSLTQVVINFSHAASVTTGNGLRFDLPNSQGSYQYKTLGPRDARSFLRGMVLPSKTRATRKPVSGWI